MDVAENDRVFALQERSLEDAPAATEPFRLSRGTLRDAAETARASCASSGSVIAGSGRRSFGDGHYRIVTRTTLAAVNACSTVEYANTAMS